MKFSTTNASAHATVSRAGHVYAAGRAIHGSRGTRLLLTSRNRLRAGSYTLTLSSAHHAIGHETVVVS